MFYTYIELDLAAFKKITFKMMQFVWETLYNKGHYDILRDYHSINI